MTCQCEGGFTWYLLDTLADFALSIIPLSYKTPNLVLLRCATNLILVLVVRVDDLLYLILRAEEHTAPVVNVLWHHL